MKKILFLSLGAGKINTENDEAGYDETTYTIYDPENKVNKEYRSNFVAEPIIYTFKPDEIFVLGTVKSIWHKLYASLITDDNNDKSYLENVSYKELLEIARDNTLGHGTSDAEIKKIQTTVSKIFGELNQPGKCKKLNGEPLKINILITKYGINEAELKENYSIIKGIEDHIEKDEDYKVAFDITLSFRSLPIYNLIIFNYIKNITKFKLEITHVYYGNLELTRELKKAHIVDLKDLVDILNLTNSVAEFKNTGNTVSLLELTESESSLNPILKNFSLTMQLNAFDLIKEDLIHLVDVCEPKGKTVPANRYTGVKEMILTVLGDKFFGINDLSAEKVRNISNMELKFLLTKWFFNQNQMGLGLATGLEALRDLNTPVFMQARNIHTGDERKYRENAETYFIQIAENLSKKIPRSELENAVCNLGTNLKKYKQIRNTFAHSLESGYNDHDIESVRESVNQFRTDLFILKNCHVNDVKSNANKYLELFSPGQNAIIAHHSTLTESCRVIIDLKKGTSSDLSQYHASKSGKRYDVYKLPPEVKSKILLNGMYAKGKVNFITEKAYFMYRYLSKQLPKDYSEIQIVLLNAPSSEIETAYRIFLENLSCFSQNKPFPIYNQDKVAYKKLGIPINMDELAKEFEENIPAYIAFEEIPLIKVTD